MLLATPLSENKEENPRVFLLAPLNLWVERPPGNKHPEGLGNWGAGDSDSPAGPGDPENATLLALTTLSFQESQVKKILPFLYVACL